MTARVSFQNSVAQTSTCSAKIPTARFPPTDSNKGMAWPRVPPGSRSQFGNYKGRVGHEPVFAFPLYLVGLPIAHTHPWLYRDHPTP